MRGGERLGQNSNSRPVPASEYSQDMAIQIDIRMETHSALSTYRAMPAQNPRADSPSAAMQAICVTDPAEVPS